MSATEVDPDIEAIVQEFNFGPATAVFVRTQRYTAYSGVLEGEASILRAAAEKLRAAARGPIAKGGRLSYGNFCRGLAIVC